MNSVRLELLELLGVTYLTDALLGACARLRKQEAYRIYETDCLYGIASALGLKIHGRYAELIQHSEPEEDRTGKEIAIERLEHFGIKVVE